MSEALPAAAPAETEVGSYFVANYPPFSRLDARRPSRATPAGAATRRRADVPLGLYLHIPFCRKRCHFCYFRVYTDKNAARSPSTSTCWSREWELYAKLPAIAGRPLNFVYFGGGTPSFLSTAQLESLVDRLDRDHAVERTRRRSRSSASRERSPRASWPRSAAWA